MKMAKIFAIMFAVILAVFCLNGPFAFGEHPWDETVTIGGDDGGLDGTDPDPDDGSDKTDRINSTSTTVETKTDVSDFLTLLKVTLVASTVL